MKLKIICIKRKCSRRSYGSALSEQQAIRELQKNAYIQFEPELIEVFIEKVLNMCFLFK
ncbi:hypothetical protein [Clostridium kluyveri]|uniref:hypothetical protein n=1 Tax=Clostridium kluyveri TaxID=1534 RepID=UPI000AA86853|nr:hypothetical protein [Clostridium kluyveri]UZQ50946.1 hypothetical protein OP486_01845 [Clostridium kluyveri]